MALLEWPCAEAVGPAEESAKIFFALSGEYHFYGQLAADELGMPIVPLT